MKNKAAANMAHKQLGFKWLGVRRSRLQAFCSVDKKRPRSPQLLIASSDATFKMDNKQQKI